MTIFNTIETRRSIRNYSGEPVEDEVIDQLLKAAMYAPSARNQQPWHFLVIKNKLLLKKIPKFHPYSSMVPLAELAIMVCADLNLEKSKGYWPVDCAAATQNLLLAAHGHGLGAVWLGVYPREERMNGCRALFELPGNIHPFALIAVGYPASVPVHPNRYNPERIHIDKW